MGLRKYAAKRDSTEHTIVEALRAAGYVVYRLSDRALPDLAVNWRGSGRGWLLLECKSPEGDLNPVQRKWWQETEGTHRFVVRTTEEAISVCKQWLRGNPP